MTGLRKGVRNDDFEQGTFGRYRCTACGTKLTRIERTGEAGQAHQCPDCRRHWKQLR